MAPLSKKSSTKLEINIYNKVIINITSINTSVQHFISHVKSCSDTEELIFTLQKANQINTTLDDNMKKLQIMSANVVNANWEASNRFQWKIANNNLMVLFGKLGKFYT